MLWFRKKRYRGYEEEKEKDRHLFTDSDRILATQKLKLNQKQREILKKIELKEMELRLKELDQQLQDISEPDDKEDEGSDIEDKLMMLMMNKFTQSQSQPPSPNTPSKPNLPDETIRELVSKMMTSKARKKLSKLSDEALQDLIKSQISQYDDNTIIRAVQIIKEG